MILHGHDIPDELVAEMDKYGVNRDFASKVNQSTAERINSLRSNVEHHKRDYLRITSRPQLELSIPEQKLVGKIQQAEKWKYFCLKRNSKKEFDINYEAIDTRGTHSSGWIVLAGLYNFGSWDWADWSCIRDQPDEDTWEMFKSQVLHQIK